MKKILKNVIKIGLPLLLAGGILFYMYRDFDFAEAKHIFLSEMNVWWLFASLVPIILSHVFRGARWLLTLGPLGYRPRLSNSIYSIFISYAANILIPRVGEVSRCGVLARYDGVPFTKGLGTLVAERLIDFLIVLLFVSIVLVTQSSVFASFFSTTGTNEDAFVNLLTNGTLYLSLFIVVVVIALFWLLFRKSRFYAKVKRQLLNFVEGLLSLKDMQHKGLFLLYTIGIWVCFFLEFYVTFYCFPFTAQLGVVPALVIFAAISVAIVIPTPNGAGPWHFVVVTMMALYGVATSDAAAFALIVHAFQTLGVIVLGTLSWIMVQIQNNNKSLSIKQ